MLRKYIIIMNVTEIMLRYIVSFLAVLLLIILGVVLFSGGTKKEVPKPTSTTKVLALPDYATTSANASITIDGRINGEDTHRAIRITVSNNERSIDILQGYSGNVIDSHRYTNSVDAFNVFLRALDNQRFLLARKGVKNTDDRGQCPLGNRFIFKLTQEGKDLSRLWSSTCNGVGTFAGKSANTQELFKKQIPDYDKITAQVRL